MAKSSKYKSIKWEKNPHDDYTKLRQTKTNEQTKWER